MKTCTGSLMSKKNETTTVEIDTKTDNTKDWVNRSTPMRFWSLLQTLFPLSMGFYVSNKANQLRYCQCQYFFSFYFHFLWVMVYALLNWNNRNAKDFGEWPDLFPQLHRVDRYRWGDCKVKICFHYYIYCLRADIIMNNLKEHGFDSLFPQLHKGGFICRYRWM